MHHVTRFVWGQMTAPITTPPPDILLGARPWGKHFRCMNGPPNHLEAGGINTHSTDEKTEAPIGEGVTQ